MKLWPRFASPKAKPTRQEPRGTGLTFDELVVRLSRRERPCGKINMRQVVAAFAMHHPARTRGLLRVRKIMSYSRLAAAAGTAAQRWSAA
jgi:hypothetical protein